MTTDRLRLRPWRDDDLEAYAAINADPDVMTFLGGPMTREQTREQIDRFRDHWARHGFGLFATELLADGTLVGFVGVQHWQQTPDVEVGWRLARAAWGAGLATEAATSVLEWAFGALALPEVISVIAPENHRSLAVAKRLGMTHRRDDVAPPRMVPVQVFALTADEWRSA